MFVEAERAVQMTDFSCRLCLPLAGEVDVGALEGEDEDVGGDADFFVLGLTEDLTECAYTGAAKILNTS